MLLFHHCNGISIRDPEPQAARPRSFRRLKPPRVRLEIGTKFRKKLKKLNDTFRMSSQRRTVPEGTVRALVIVVVPIERHDEHILLRR